ncbi:hypothetical protein JMJ35_003517 [Cladonia borealis]|uniref:O-methyltransferase C-terminal domain-containing protein n=1 Tax=Cladonia borealis TaxID=184061 RepID=A0AA39V8W9_9LECA|nr:hypothetical protein JMJ35_003517 [Cladonia borealis]
MEDSANSGLLATAKQIHNETALLVQQLQLVSIEEPSAEPNCATALWETHNSSIKAASNRIVALSRSLAQTIDGPKRYLWEFVGGAHYTTASLATILEFSVLEKIPLDGEAHVSHLAQACGLGEDKLLRLLRMIACDKVVYETRDSYFRHSSISAVLVTDKYTRALMEMQLGEASRASTHLAETLKENPGDNRSGFCAFKSAWGEVPFQWYANHPERARRFALAMEGTTRGNIFSRSAPADLLTLTYWHLGLGWSLDLIHRWFEANEICDNDLVIDVGGGSGHVCVSLAKAFPTPSFIVQDLVDTMYQANLQGLPEALQKRFRFQRHDFLEPQPLSDASRVKVYLLRMVLWNWADDIAVKILQTFVPVMKQFPGISLLINDGIHCRPGILEPHVEKEIRQLDMAMMVMNNAKVREEHQWRELLTKASPNFELVRTEVEPSVAETVALMEVRWIDRTLQGAAQEDF